MAEQLPVTRSIVTNNHDVASLVRRLDRLLVEVTKSASSNVSALMPFDLARVQQRWRYADDKLAPGESLSLDALAHDVALLPDQCEGPPDKTR